MMENDLIMLPCIIQPHILKLPPSSKFKTQRSSNATLNIRDNEDRPMCRVLDVVMETITSIDYITFSNYYTHTITIKWLPSGLDPSNMDSWKNCIQNLKLMTNCHCEHESQNWIVLGKEDFEDVLMNVKQLRVILKQPSVNWKEYGIQQFACYSKICSPPKTQLQTTQPHSHSTDDSEIATKLNQMLKITWQSCDEHMTSYRSCDTHVISRPEKNKFS